jgi:polyphosphate glucokinase
MVPSTVKPLPQDRTGSLANNSHAPKKVLVTDIGGTSVKLLVSGQQERRMLPSGCKMTPDKMVRRTLELVSDWDYSVVSIGYPGPVLRGRPICEPYNLGRGWVGFDFATAFRRPIKVVNDAAMQALGSYKGGTMLFLGLGTGFGTAMIVDGIIEPMELGHLRYKKATYEDYLGRAGLERLGKRRWRHHVEDVVERLIAVLEPDDVVIGGGNVKKLKKLPLGCRTGDNNNAFLGGFRLWEDPRETARASGSLPCQPSFASRPFRSSMGARRK